MLTYERTAMPQATATTKVLKMTQEEYEASQLNTSIISSFTLQNGNTVVLCVSHSELVYVIVR